MPKTRCDESCSGVPGGQGLGYQVGLLWRCPRCGRVWRLNHAYTATAAGLWVWELVPVVIRWLIDNNIGRWTWAHEVGVQ